jgi:hypothetical protein
MWFDVSAAVVHLQSSDTATALIRMTENKAPQIAEVAGIAGHHAPNAKPAPIARADGLSPDAGEYLDFLHLHGPSTYGAFATALGWGATRAWQAEARLRAAGLVRYDGLGKAMTVVKAEQVT